MVELLFFLTIIALAGAIWAGYPQDQNKRSQGENQGDEASFNFSGFLRRTPNYAKQGIGNYAQYIKKPKNQIATATLAAVITYTWITHQQYISGGQNDRRALRAYISIDSASEWVGCNDCSDFSRRDFVPPADPGALRNRLYINIAPTNVGKTPAYGVSACIRIIQPPPGVTGRLDTDFRCEIPNIKLQKVNLESGGNDQMLIPEANSPDTIQPKVINDIYMGKHSLAWFGQVNYRDVFGHQWVTPFCFYFSLRGQGQCVSHNIPNDSE